MNHEPKENAELLTSNVDNKNGPKNHNHRSDDPIDNPPDGGFRAYLIVLASFLINGLMFGVINSYSNIFNVLQQQLKDIGDPNPNSKASLVGTLTMGTTFLLSPVSGILTAYLGLRKTAVLGGLIATFSLIVSSFVTTNITALCFTYGILYGIGVSLSYTPSLAILSHYFKVYLSRVNGFVTIGSSIFSVIIPKLMEYMIRNYGLEWLFRVLAVLTFGVVLCGLLFKPIPLLSIEEPVKGKNGVKQLFKVIIDVHIWKKIQYRIWALSLPVALFGYFISYVFIKKFVEENFPLVDANLPLQCIAVTSGIGRLVFGFLGDRPNIDKILLQQISFYVIGTLTIIFPFVRSFPWVLVVVSGMGLFDGAFIALIGPIAVELCGSHYAGQSIGMMLGMAAIPLCLGPMVAGYIHDATNTYAPGYVMAGISPLVGATLMFAVRFFGRRQSEKNKDIDTEQSGPLHIGNGHAKQDQTAL